MFKLYTAILLLVILGVTFADNQTRCGQTDFPPFQTDYIINGEDARKGGWPWQISLRLYGSHMCGGSILDERWIMTAAHCLLRSSNPASYKIHVGEHDFRYPGTQRKVMAVEKIIKHSYGSVTGPNDIALIKLKEPITFGKYVKPICMPNKNDSGNAHVNNDDCWTSGWGYTKYGVTRPNILQQVNVKVLTEAACKAQWGSYIKSYHICMGSASPHEGVCNGDSGGPLMCKRNGEYALLGITSWVYRGCTQRPSVFTRVTEYFDWIAKNKQ